MSTRERVAGSRKLAGWLVFIGIFSALNYAGNFLSDAEPDRSAVYQWSTPVLGVIQYSILLAITAWIAAGAPPREMFALYRPHELATRRAGSPPARSWPHSCSPPRSSRSCRRATSRD